MRYKYILWLIVLFLSIGNIKAQNTSQVTAIQYYFNTDPGVGIAGNGAIVPVTSTSICDTTLNFTLPSSPALPLGFNNLYVRVQDDFGRWSIAERRLFYIATYDSNNIVAYQYYFDTDPGVGAITANSGVVAINSTTNNDTLLHISIPTLSTGFHTLFVRTKNDLGRWSIAERRTFYIATYDANNIVAYQYYFDTDPGVGAITANSGVVAINSTTNNDTLLPITIPTLSTGFHTLFVRTKNTSGIWSIAERNMFYVVPNNNMQTLTELEYYFDTDPGVGNGVAYPVTSSSLLNITASFISPCLTNGNHYLYFRAKDAFGRWSIIERDTIAITAGVNPFTVSPSGPINVCASDSVTLTTTSVPGIAYQWLKDGNEISGATTISYVVHSTGIYSVRTTCGAATALSANSVSINVAPLNTYYKDADADGYGNLLLDSVSCTQPVGYVSNHNDCNDGNINIHPGATEICDGIDNNCNGTIDEGVKITYYEDLDGDLFGNINVSVLACSPPPNYVLDNTDCDDGNILIHAPVIYYVDADDDGYGATATGTFCQLNPPLHYSTNNNDCNDASASEHPGQVWYLDFDNDGYKEGTSTISCLRPVHYKIATELLSTSIDCNDTVASIHPGATEVCNGADDNCDGTTDEGVKITYYQDSDGDTYGNSAVSQLACSAPANYVLDHTDCNDALAVEHPGQVWYIDTDGDHYGRNGAAIIQCSRPANGYVANELVATSGDCDDNNAAINPGSRYFAFTGNTNFTNSIINPTIGTSYTNFHIEVNYFDGSNALPAANFPRLQLDFEGNGYSNSDINDRIYLMSEDDPSDISTNNGKTYFVNINGLPTGTNWTAKIVSSDGGSCATSFGPFNNPDVFELPNLVIFANDINIFPVHPNPGDTITVSATVHNASDYDADNFHMHLTNQYDSINFVYPDVVVSNLLPHGTTTVTWTVVTPPIAAFVPMEVRIDETNVIDETNELDNRALRPFVNGNYNLPGGIVCTARVSPFKSNSSASNFPVLSGNVHYYGLAVPLADSSVAGATVSCTIIETGTQFTGYTGSNGYYSIPFPGPINVGIYHIHVNVTDYTLTGSCDTVFQILPSINKPDLANSVTLGYTGGIPGNSLSGIFTVTNNGNATAGPSLLHVNQSAGTPTIGDFNVGTLAPGQSQTFSFGPITTTSPGTVSICGYADAGYVVDESNEANNSSCPSIYSYGGGGGGYGFTNLGAGGFGNGGGYVCNATHFYIALTNSGNLATGAFDVQVLIYKNNVLQTTLTQTIANINGSSTVYANFPYNYSSVGPGNYSYTVNIDINNTVVESNEGNNTTFYNSVLLPCHPDLAFIYCDSLSVLQSNVQQGGNVTLEANVINKGKTSAVGPIAVRFNYSDGGVYNAQYNGNIAIGQEVAVSVSAPVPTPGTTVYATIDPLNQIGEEMESDNISPTWKLCYDFRIDTLCGKGSNIWDENYNPFEMVNLRAGISNLGLLNASDVKVRFQISGPGIVGTQNLGDAIVPSINKLCNCPTEAFLPNGYVFTQNGLYTITITADPLNEFAECDESNNVRIIHLIVSEIPEYRILSQYINPSLLNPDVNQPVSFVVTYENKGREDLNDSMRLNFLADNVLLSSIFPVSGIPKNAHASVAIPSWSSSIPGIHILRAKIDADSVVDETNEYNNEGTRAIVIGQSANLYFQVFQPSNLVPGLYQTISINTRIGNSGDLPCEADVQYYYVSGNDTIPISNLLHVVVPANDSVTLLPFDWIVTNNSTKLIGKIINSASLEYSYDDNITAVQIGAFSLSFVTTHASCSGSTDGTATATATGGSPPYSYLWMSGNNSVGAGPLLTNGIGNYTIVVTDNHGQTATGSVTITSTPDVVNPVFLNCPGNISLCYPVATWTPPSATDNCSTPNVISNHLPGETFPLGSTTVTYTATDANGNSSTCSFVISISTPLVWYLDVDSDGYYTGIPVSSCSSPGAGYSTTVIPGGDCNDIPVAGFNIHPGAPEICNGIDDNCNGQIDELCCSINLSGVITTVKCKGYNTGAINVSSSNMYGTPTYIWNNGSTNEDLSNLFASTYTVTVSYFTGCTASASYIVSQPESILSISLAKVSIRCAGKSSGQITALPSGGVPPYFYLWSNGATTSKIAGITLGYYTITITDSEGCAKTKTTLLTQNPAMLLMITPSADSATTQATGGISPYSYHWKTTPVQTTATATGLSPGESYKVKVTDNKGCTKIGTIVMPASKYSEYSNDENFIVFPNPTNGFITIAGFSKSNAIIKITLQEATGRIINQSLESASTGFISKDFSHLSYGVYMLTIEAGDKRKTIKLILEE